MKQSDKINEVEQWDYWSVMLRLMKHNVMIWQSINNFFEQNAWIIYYLFIILQSLKKLLWIIA